MISMMHLWQFLLEIMRGKLMKYIKYGHGKWIPKVDLYDKRQIDELIIKVSHSRAGELEFSKMILMM